MFTIKHIDHRNTEHLIEAVEVWYKDNLEDVAGTDSPVIRALHYTNGTTAYGEYLTRKLDFGRVYVMNYNGKTIADYVLSDE
jgi:hypothetical protein